MSDSSSDDDLPLSQLNRKSGNTKTQFHQLKQSEKRRKETRKRTRVGSDTEGELSVTKRIGSNAQGRDHSPIQEKSSKLKELTRVQRLEQGIAAFEWWNAPDPPKGRAWQTLEHCGMTFEPQYKPHGTQVLYDADPVTLTPYQEELATFYAAMPEDGPQLNAAGGQREIFQKNFWDDWREALGKGHVIKSFSGCDFSRISKHLDRLKFVKRAASDAEKLTARELRDDCQLRNGYAILDGHVEKVGNFRMEPPSLFRGRGKHPKTGVVKLRVEPDQVSINCGASRPPPVCLQLGRSWGDIKHDDTVTWLSTWHENVMQSNKYVMLAANSSLKGKSDFGKFQKAMQLKGCINRVRRDYRKNLKSKDRHLKQQATTMWLIDTLALRVGGEKSEEEADTVGCCSLRVEHFTFHAKGRDVDLEFLGKDSIRFKQSIDFATFDEHGQQAYQNIQEMCRSKKPSEQVFELIDPTSLNAHLSSIMPGLTAKVFRTYNASETLQNQLPDAKSVLEMNSIGDKLVAYNEANRIVAILCNHQRTVSAAAATGLEAQADKLEQLKDQRRELQVMRTSLKAGKKDVPLHSGCDPVKEAQLDVDAAKKQKNDAKTQEQKISATAAYEAAMVKKREASKSKLAEAHLFARFPDEKDVAKRIDAWTEKINRLEIDLRNKEENKEVSLGTSKANYLDPRISVAWCKRCNVPIEKLFSKTLKEKFAWALPVESNWRFEAMPITES